MYKLKKFRLDFEKISQNLVKKNVNIDELLKIKSLDFEYKEIQTQLEKLNEEKNKLTKVSNKNSSLKIKENIKIVKEKRDKIHFKLNNLLEQIPNICSNETISNQTKPFYWEGKKDENFKYLPYLELCKKLKLLSFSSSANVSGSGHAIYKNEGEKLLRALIDFTLDENEQKNYKRFYVPSIVLEESLFCTSQISKFKKDLFQLSEENKYLSPTGEVQLVNLFRNKLISENNLPIKMTTNTNCFRNESIGAGTNSKGLIRMFEFNKTEIVIICKPDESEIYHQQILQDVEDILKKLNLKFRRILLPANDTGFSAFKTYDIEVWFPSEKKYREISSISNTLDFQSIRGNIRYKQNILSKTEKSQNPHILNASALAIDRLFAAIIDNYQTCEEKIQIPTALKKYLRFEFI